MYSEYYGLKADPFRLSPDHNFCLHHTSFSRAKSYMQYALYRGEGFVMITGAPGTGKTTLIDDLLAGASGSELNVAKLVSGQLEADDLLRMVSYGFGIPADGMDKSEILHRLATDFSKKFKQKRRSLLIVDEAQGLSKTALEELRLLTNLRLDGHPLLQIFLVGQEELRELVTTPELEQLNQRMIAACHMESLKPEEFVSYVLHRMRVVGWVGRPTFDPGIFPLLYRFSNGVPRRINHICSRLLLHGCLEEKARLDAGDIELVIDELKAEHYAIKEHSSIIDLDVFDADDVKALAEAALSSRPALKPESREKEAVGRRGPKPQIPPRLQEEQIIEPGLPVARRKPLRPVRKKGKRDSRRETKKLSGIKTGSTAEKLPGSVAESAVQVRAGSARQAGFPGRLWRMDPLWGAAGALFMVFFILLVVLVSVPAHELRGVAGQSLWDNSGVAAIRSRMLHWSGGSWPLNSTTFSSYPSSYHGAETELAAYPPPWMLFPPQPDAGPVTEDPGTEK